jgi:hypothetical protein
MPAALLAYFTSEKVRGYLKGLAFAVGSTAISYSLQSLGVTPQNSAALVAALAFLGFHLTDTAVKP